jgi:hypothetical protein
MGRWIIANLNGGLAGEARIISAAGMDALHAPVAEAEDEFHAYAMGWVVRPYWEALVVAGEQPADYPIPALVEHGGAAPDGHTYVGLVPERGWGFALLMNIFDEADQEPYLHVEQGIQRILARKEPLPLALGLDPLGRNVRATGLLLLFLELVSLSWSVWTLRRSADPARGCQARPSWRWRRPCCRCPRPVAAPYLRYRHASIRSRRSSPTSPMRRGSSCRSPPRRDLGPDQDHRIPPFASAVLRHAVATKTRSNLAVGTTLSHWRSAEEAGMQDVDLIQVIRRSPGARVEDRAYRRSTACRGIATGLATRQFAGGAWASSTSDGTAPGPADASPGSPRS